jgi:hypothetical protein
MAPGSKARATAQAVTVTERDRDRGLAGPDNRGRLLEKCDIVRYMTYDILGGMNLLEDPVCRSGPATAGPADWTGQFLRNGRSIQCGLLLQSIRVKKGVRRSPR